MNRTCRNSTAAQIPMAPAETAAAEVMAEQTHDLVLEQCQKEKHGHACGQGPARHSAVQAMQLPVLPGLVQLNHQRKGGLGKDHRYEVESERKAGTGAVDADLPRAGQVTQQKVRNSQYELKAQTRKHQYQGVAQQRAVVGPLANR